MKKSETRSLLSGQLLDDDIEMTLADLCRVCQLPAERVFELVEYGVIEPSGKEPVQWRFQALSIRRVYCAQRLEQDLGVNIAGAALALDLIEELDQLRSRVRRLEERD